jgi:hypothetical protein
MADAIAHGIASRAARARAASHRAPRNMDAHISA